MNQQNRFEEYYLQRTTNKRQLKIEFSAKIKKQYQAAFSNIYMLLDKSRRDQRYGTVIFNRGIIKDARAIVADFIDASRDLFYDYGKIFSSLSVMSEIEDLKDYNLESKNKSEDYDRFIDIYVDESLSYLSLQCDRILTQINSYISKDSMVVRRIMLLDEVDRKKAVFKHKNSKNFVFELFFVDKMMRKRSVESYFGILANSYAQMIELDSYMYAMVNDGFDLAIILHCDGEKSCSKYDGVIVSVSGENKQYISIEELRSAGKIWHPNCSHLIKVFREHNGIN